MFITMKTKKIHYNLPFGFFYSEKFWNFWVCFGIVLIFMRNSYPCKTVLYSLGYGISIWSATYIANSKMYVDQSAILCHNLESYYLHSAFPKIPIIFYSATAIIQHLSNRLCPAQRKLTQPLLFSWLPLLHNITYSIFKLSQVKF